MPRRLKSKLGPGVLDATQLLDLEIGWCRMSPVQNKEEGLASLFQGKSSSAAVYFEILWQVGGPSKLQVRAHMWGFNWPYLSHLIGPSNKGLSMR